MLRMTQQREIILQELEKFPGHPTADELYEKVKKKLSRISLATVYRNLEILTEAGRVSKIEISGRQKRFDSELHHHDHVFCLNCRRVDNIDLEKKSRAALKPKSLCGYAIEGYRIEFKGTCPDCLTKKQPKGGRTMGCKKCGPAELNDKQRKVLEAFAKSKDACGSKDIAAATGLESKQVGCQITALKKKGFVESPVRCKYSITKEGKKVLA